MTIDTPAIEELTVWIANHYNFRWTPLHHRAYPHVYRLSTAHRKDALAKVAEMLRHHGVGATDPLRKLDGAFYIEVF